MRLEAIVLAAGAGSRFGGDKLTAVYRGRPLLDYALDAALAAPVRSVSVVVRTGDHATRSLVEKRASASNGRLRALAAPDAAEGLAASLRTAVLALPADTEGAFVFLGDMPGAPHDLGAALAAGLSATARIVAPVHDGRRGHPVLFGRACFPALAALEGDRGAQALLAAAGPALALVETDHPGVLFDVDLREDLDRG